MSGSKATALGVIGIILGACGIGFGALNMINFNSINLLNMDQSNQSARAYRSGNTGQATAGWITVYLNAESYDPGNNFDTSTYTYTVPENGLYLITATVGFTDATASNLYRIGIHVNGTLNSMGRLVCSSGGEFTLSITDVLNLTVNDAVYVRYNNPTGAFLTVAGTEHETFMVVTKI